MTTLKRLLKYLLLRKFELFLSVITAVPTGAIEGIVAYLLKPVLDNILISKNLSLLVTIPILIIILFTIGGISRYFQLYYTRYVVQNMLVVLRNDLHAKFQRLPLAFHQKIHSGDLISRITNDASVLEITLTDGIHIFLTRFISLVALVFVVFYQNWFLALICMGVISLIIYPLISINKKIKSKSHTMQKDLANITRLLSETIKGIRVVKGYALEKEHEKEFEKENQVFFESYMKMVKSYALLSPVLYIVGALAIAAIIWTGGYFVIHGSLTVGALISFIVAFLLMYTPIKTLGRVLTDYQRATASAERMFEILDQPEENYNEINTQPFPGLIDRIDFKNVTFAYNQDFVLKDCSFSIPYGKLVALVGHSGSGKSTLANLLVRFYDVLTGEICINGINIKNFALKDLRNHIAYVGQDVFLFNKPIRENIKVGNKEASENDIFSAAKTSYIHDMILSLPKQYDTDVGELGDNFSGGEKQRISIARAVVKDAPILILDEATSALDNQSEAIVKKAIDNLIQNKTVLVIAHKLNTIKNADQIIVMDRGRIVGMGTHEQLMKESDVYKNLYKNEFDHNTLEENLVSG